jgi:hypothetical protein
MGLELYFRCNLPIIECIYNSLTMASPFRAEDGREKIDSGERKR